MLPVLLMSSRAVWTSHSVWIAIAGIASMYMIASYEMTHSTVVLKLPPDRAIGLGFLAGVINSAFLSASVVLILSLGPLVNFAVVLGLSMLALIGTPIIGPFIVYWLVQRIAVK
jgi:hypothetical protein